MQQSSCTVMVSKKEKKYFQFQPYILHLIFAFLVPKEQKRKGKIII